MSEIKNSYHFIYAIKTKFQPNGNFNKLNIQKLKIKGLEL
jgi:hypothetical protein